MIAAWTRSKSLFSSTNNSRSRVPFSCFNSAAFCSSKPFSFSSSSASLLPEALLDTILLTERHGSKQQTSVTPSHLPIFVPHSSAVGKVDQGLSNKEIHNFRPQRGCRCVGDWTICGNDYTEGVCWCLQYRTCTSASTFRQLCATISEISNLTGPCAGVN